MNWPRARLWLIISFLVLDLVLAWALLSGTVLPAPWRSPPTRALSSQLARYGLELQATLPATPASLALQRLERVPPPEWLLPQLYPDGAPVPQASQGASGTELVYRGDGIVTVVEPGGRVVVYYVGIVPYPAGPPAASGSIVAPDQKTQHEQRLTAALQAAEAWIDEWGGPPQRGAEARATVDAATGYGTVTWRYSIDGLPLYGSNMRLILAPSADNESFRIGQWDRRWLRLLGPAGDPRPPVPAQTALLRLAGHLESIDDPGGIITAVTLGYYTGEYRADAWEVPPVWRLDLADGRFFYVNALTGQLEVN